MSSVLRGSGARGCVLLAIALLACSGKGSNDLFAPATSTGTCTTNCGPGGAATTGPGGGGSSSSSSTTSAGGASSSSTTGMGGGGAGGAATTGGGAGTTGGGSVGGTAGSGSGGSPDEDSGITPIDDAQVIDAVVVIDSGVADRGLDAVVGRDACVTTGMEVCDGLDNNCNGGTDENACRTGCVGAAYNGRGYMLCYGQSQRRDWRAADNDCRNHNMRLIRVDDAQQNAFIRKTALGVGYTDSIWIGGSDLNREGVWVWTDGVQFWQGGVTGHTVDGHFAAWDMNQPNSADGPEDCAAVWTGIETWHDVNCSVFHAYMCQETAQVR